MCSGIATDRYPVYLSTDSTLHDLLMLVPTDCRTFFVIDQTVTAAHPRFTEFLTGYGDVLRVMASETTKSWEGLGDLLRRLLFANPTSDDQLVIIGGGSVLNLGGLAASLAMRGLTFAYVPTTLTAQIDVCIGSKQAVNLDTAKNWVGLRNDPEACYVNPYFLPSLSDRELLSQAVEGVKLCLATDRGLFGRALRAASHLVDRRPADLSAFVSDMLRAKLAVLDIDLAEQHYGRSMLYGHTLGHAIEMQEPGRLTHGEAVALGMLTAARIAHALEIAQEDLISPHLQVLRELGLPSRIPGPVNPEALVAALQHDKKRRGGGRVVGFILLERVGEMAAFEGSYVTPVTQDVLTTAIKESS